MADLRLPTPLLRVWRDSDDQPRDLQTTNRDLLLWEDTALKHRWPEVQKLPSRFQTFIAWAAARRTQLIDQAVTWEAWRDDVLAVQMVEDPEDDAGRPTDPAPDTD